MKTEIPVYCQIADGRGRLLQGFRTQPARGEKMKLTLKLVFAIIVAAGLATGLALAAGPDGAAANTIPPGTQITMQNWNQYKQFMPDGMVALFQGNYF